MFAEWPFLAFGRLIRVMVAGRGFWRAVDPVAAREMLSGGGSLNPYPEKGRFNY